MPPHTTIQEIKDGEKVLAIIFPHDLPADGVKFLTPESYPLQIGLLAHPQGKFVPAHYHPHLKYNVVNTQEFLYVIKGAIEVEIFNHTWKSFMKTTLTAGDSVLFVDCGHAVNLPADSRVIEVKQGPYPGLKNSKVFQDEALNKKLSAS